MDNNCQFCNQQLVAFLTSRLQAAVLRLAVFGSEATAGILQQSNISHSETQKTSMTCSSDRECSLRWPPRFCSEPAWTAMGSIR